MRLTQLQKKAFVRAVMADIPLEDHKQAFREYITKRAFAKLPKEIRTIADNPTLAPYLYREWEYISGAYCMGSVYIIKKSDAHLELTDEEQAEVGVIHAKFKDQQEKIHEIQAKLNSAINSVTTIKQAKEVLPDLIKYIPSEATQATNNLPLVIGLSDELKALGLNITAQPQTTVQGE
jgi:hypothetical protein